MGFSKYTEDNLEITYERFYMKGEERVVTVAPKENRHSKINCETAVSKLIEMWAKQDYEEDEAGNKYIFCKDCGRRFLFSVPAQKQFAERGWKSPKRCKRCRTKNELRSVMRSSF